MSLTDQEQVILRAIKSLLRTPTSPALIADVVKAVGYPKATTKKVLARLAEKGVIAIHRHDYPASLTPAERKLMLRLRDGQGNWGYYSAVSMRARNPKKSKGKAALKRAGRALKGFAQGALSAGAEILGAGAQALNPVRRRVKNKYIDLVIRGQAKKTPQGWKVGQKTFTQGRGTTKVSSNYYLDRSTGLVYAKRERNKARKKAGKKHASRASRANKTSSSRRHRVAAKTGRRANGSRKASAPARRKPVAKTRKAPASRVAGKRNPSAESIRKEFAGRHNKDSKLYFPDGTPTGLAKLGKLIMIETKAGPIELSNLSGEVWLCADTHKRFHLGSTIKAPLFDGAARNFGEVKMIEYQESKPHLGYRKTIWFHEMGEEGGRRPTLHANSKGELKFKGGDYRITVRGIEN